jgi:hypothetical protein
MGANGEYRCVGVLTYVHTASRHADDYGAKFLFHPMNLGSMENKIVV